MFSKVFLVVALLPAVILSHATLNPSVGPANSYFASSLRVPHACGISPTISVTVTIPDAFSSVKPQNVANWTITIKTKPLAVPIKTETKTIIETVDTITWSGGYLLNEHYQDFGLSFKVGNGKDGDVFYFPTVQGCVNGSTPWIDIPPAKTYPAPKFTIESLPNKTAASTSTLADGQKSGASSDLQVGLWMALGGLVVIL